MCGHHILAGGSMAHDVFFFIFIVDHQEKQQLWLLEELMMLKRKLDDANREISKTNAEIYGKNNILL